METLRNVLVQTQQHGVAIGHFNISDLVLLKAVVAAARELDVPVIVSLRASAILWEFARSRLW